ncbi:hypothetical protein NZ698_01280 [Chryseobacterium sp. PBS4-4]|uniref:Uncharacterized protein n=1 Tax=Chryseobacterium edaphi TaxID=2976532 RepID=A0ABT2W0V1_9FLAO|nr:hypothetical protein [Chryseobacterium edaphi]MCU7615816.1 hypothetical protein [Chryseobacterium edaphi]
MKNIFLTAFALIGTLASAQVAIGKDSVSSNAVSLEFGAGNKGMVLPYVTNTAAVTGAVNGTIVYDTSDHRVKVKYASGWKDLSLDATGAADTTIQNSKTDDPAARVSITTGTPTTVPGILVLEDDNKAMILPKVDSPHLNIQNPAPGMMVYDTVKKQLAVYNGTVWSFWK